MTSQRYEHESWSTDEDSMQQRPYTTFVNLEGDRNRRNQLTLQEARNHLKLQGSLLS